MNEFHLHFAWGLMRNEDLKAACLKARCLVCFPHFSLSRSGRWTSSVSMLVLQAGGSTSPHLSLSFMPYTTHHKPIPHARLHCPFCSPSLAHQLYGNHLDHCSPAIWLMSVLQSSIDTIRNPTSAARMQVAKSSACLPWRLPGCWREGLGTCSWLIPGRI